MYRFRLYYKGKLMRTFRKVENSKKIIPYIHSFRGMTLDDALKAGWKVEETDLETGIVKIW